MKYVYNERAFLNEAEDGGIACIEAYVIEAANDGMSVDATVSISDCNRMISLDFSIWGADQTPKKLKKLRNLIKILTKLEKALIKESKKITKKSSLSD